MERGQWPILVRFILWGVRRRSVAIACLLLSLLVTVAGVVAAFWDARGLAGLALIPGVLGYAWAIRWVDRNGKWA